MGKFENKTVLITGAARGMGKAIARAFLKEGANVAITDINENNLIETSQELTQISNKLIYMVSDVSKREDNEKMIDSTVEKFGQLDILVNNAGLMDNLAAIKEATDETYNKVMGVNVYGPLCSTRKAIDVFTQQQTKGIIINIASVGGIRPCGGAIYCASKAALLSLTRSTAFTYYKEGIRCNAILPGGMTLDPNQTGPTPNMDGFARIQPFLNLLPGSAENNDIANAVLFLASDAAKSINGVSLQVDCGWSVA